MPLINKIEKRAPKGTLSVRMDEAVKEQLDLYCSFIQSGRQHVVDQALRLLFDRDADFQTWLKQRASPPRGQTASAG
jgi:hypothetical protein